MNKNKDRIEFMTFAKLNKEGNLQWHIEISWKSDEISEEFKDALWEQFTIEVEDEK